MLIEGGAGGGGGVEDPPPKLSAKVGFLSMFSLGKGMPPASAISGARAETNSSKNDSILESI